MDGKINVCFGITKTTERAVYVTNKMYSGWIPKKLCTINGYIVSTVEKWFAWKNGFYTPTDEELEKERIEQEELDEIRKWAYASYIEHYESFGDRL